MRYLRTCDIINPMEKLPNEEVIIIEEPRVARADKMPDRFLAISILAAAVIIGGSIVFSTVYKGGVAPAGTAENGAANTGGAGTAAAPAPANNDAAMTPGPRDAILGKTDAPVTIIEYGDYQCPFCTQFFSQTEPQIVADYVTPGFVKMVFRNFAFLGPESLTAAAAAECANDQGKLWAYHDALYAAKVGDEQKGGGESDGFYSRAKFLQLATQVGLDATTFTSCLDSNKYAALVNKEKGDGAAVGVDSTPTFYVNGQQIKGAQPYSVFKSTIDGLLKG